MNPRHCPECDSADTHRVHVEWSPDVVEEIRVCDDCPTEYTVCWGIPWIGEVAVYD